MFCEQKSFRKDKALICVASFEFCKTLEQRAEDKCDYAMQCKVGDFSKLIANDARYHKACHSKYIVRRQKTPGDSEAGTSNMPHTRALHDLFEEVKPHLDQGRALTMVDLLAKYQHLLQRHVTEEEAKRFTRQKLKQKLETEYGQLISVLPSPGNKPDIVVSSDLQLTDVINTAANLTESLKNIRAEAELSSGFNTDIVSPRIVLYHAALVVRSLRQACVGIQCQPLDPSDISQERAESMIPGDLYTFVSWLLESKAPLNLDSTNKEHIKETNPILHRHILSVCQDIAYIGSHGKCRTPKHVGLSIALHQMTQSHDVVTLVNKNGHGISYNEVERIDSSWAVNQMTPDGYVVPTNMVSGIPVRAAGDNFNRATETLDGQHFDVVNMVLYQPDTQTIGGTFGPRPKPIPTEKRSHSYETLLILECPRVGGKQPGPQHLIRKANLDWFFSCSDAHEAARAIDRAYIQARLMPMKLFEADFQKVDINQIPGWTVYHAAVTYNMNPQKTKIGYCPMIPASATEMNTIYTMMKTFQCLFRSLGQDWTYVTYDEAIYSKAQMIKWKHFDQFQTDELDMGGMHRAMNYMGDIGRLMEESAFEDILVEAKVYGPRAVHQIVKGKSYNRGVRSHKLLNEAMNRLKWTAFEEWMEENEKTLPSADRHAIADDALRLSELLQNTEPVSADNTAEIQNVLQEFEQHTRSMNMLMREFTMDGRSRSDTFLFWDNYVSFISQLLLDYIAAKRDGNRSLELETFAEMIPLDFMCGHINYARWGCVNVIEGHLLEVNKPEIHEAISGDNAAVYRTGRPFSGVWHDMGIEQSLNRDCGKFRHLYTHEGALQKYYLTAHLKATVTTMMKKMSGILQPDREAHKESTSRRISKDEEAVKTIINMVQERMVNPFQVEEGACSDDRQPLVNIATSIVAPTNVTESVCKVRESGMAELQTFVESRLQTGEVDFFSPIKKPGFKTFASLNKQVKVKKKQNVESINIDRQIFSKLTILAQNRDVDVRNLLKHELAPVPLSLFHLDGTMRKNNKSMTLSWIENDHAEQTISETEDQAILIIDLMMLLHMICATATLCKTFGDLSTTMFDMIVAMGYNYTAVVGDSYCNMESIKSGERSRRGPVQMQEIRNPSSETPFPGQKQKYLSNPANKANVADFLLNDWIEKGIRQLPSEKHLYLAGGFKDPQKAVVVTQDSHHRVEELQSDQEEADSRMFLHVQHAVKTLNVKRVVIWSLDSDVAAMCPRVCSILNVKELYLKTGTRQKKRYIPMHIISSELGSELSMVLPSIHALSGCDSTSAFSGKGKKKWLTVVSKNAEIIEGISELGLHPVDISDKALLASVNLISLMYTAKTMDSLDDVRYELFSKKGYCSEKLPPTMDAARLHIKRANYQSFIWNSATEPYQQLPSPLDAGWCHDENGHTIPDAMSQPAAPEALLDFVKCGCGTDCSSRRCGC
ncbi:MAG: hypothetical protein ABW185_10000 [Sedimenticola sp.]